MIEHLYKHMQARVCILSSVSTHAHRGRRKRERERGDERGGRRQRRKGRGERRKMERERQANGSGYHSEDSIPPFVCFVFVAVVDPVKGHQEV